MKNITLTLVALLLSIGCGAANQFVNFNGQGWLLNSAEVTIYVDGNAPKGVLAAADNLCHDFMLVTGKKAVITSQKTDAKIIVNTKANGKWERFDIVAEGERLTITGSDRRGTIYGIYELSRQMGVTPWTWWADVPVEHHDHIYINNGVYSDGEPSVKYRGIFINDEDWGLKPWATNNYEKELGDIGPKTYARVCELILRLRGNMVAPAMHSCTGAFYSHPESKVVCDSLGVIITTSHCEPLLLNNAAESEWNSKRDGEWNYATNRDVIWKKWDDRLREASHLDNIYTLAMRGVHDEGIRGNLPMAERVKLLNRVIEEQRQLLTAHKRQKISSIPQIFVPYKETMDVYENGLKVPDDVTLVWVDDNYGYMKRVSTPKEQKRKGGAGVYYHLSYLGTPHDYLWINTTAPVLMYEELMKAYRHGADRYWLLNVGDIKPMELGMQTFFDLAWNVDAFDYDMVNRHQARYLASLFLGQAKRQGRAGFEEPTLQHILDEYYRLAWIHKPEYMGGEYEWDTPQHTGLHDVDIPFETGEAQKRLADYEAIAKEVDALMQTMDEAQRIAFFELIGYQVNGSCEMNRKFLYAKLNHELYAKGRYAEANWAASQSQRANNNIEALNTEYNTMLGGKWQGMMTIPPGFCALYQNMPQLNYTQGIAEKKPDLTPTSPAPVCINLKDYLSYRPSDPKDEGGFIRGIGYDWTSLMLNGEATYALPETTSDSINIMVYSLPFFPLYPGCDTRFSVSVDGGEPQVIANHWTEWSPQWKDQVMWNTATNRLTFALDPSKQHHTLTLRGIDKGQIVQRIVIF